MKRKLLLCLLLLPLLCVAKHIEFMGIPLNMSISNFTTKATAKGIRYDREVSKMLDPGVRAFEGTFFGKSAMIFVFYNPKTKLVYRAKGCLDFVSEEAATSFLDQVKDGLETKYGEGFTENDTQDGYPSFTYTIVDKSESTIIDDEIYYVILGYVGGYITYSSSYDDPYIVHIDYIDSDNQDKNNEINLNDL